MLESIANFRDLGGNILPDGSRIKPGLLLRGGDLAKASDADLRHLSEHYHLAKVFDFRTSMEVHRLPDREVPGARNIWMPAFNEEKQVMEAMSLPQEAYLNLPVWLTDHAAEPDVQRVASILYTSMTESEFTQIQYAGFLQNIVNTTDGAVYWHCSQGKDRTGIGAAFLLAALGADRELIMKDYLLSNVYYAKDIEEAFARVSTEAERDVMLTFVGVNRKYFEAALDGIDAQWGSMKNFLAEALMLSEEDCEILRERYLERPASR